MTTDTPVGIVGLGLMGFALSVRLIDAKIPLVGFDIDPLRCGMFKATGGMVATSVRELAACSRTIIVAVYSGEQVEALFGEIDDGAGAARPVVICITTCGPGEIIGIAERASRAGLPLLEAPISGTRVCT
jgi:3-hydroxyisobutyrate dehydrogenase-like beta-hydroxyacid dehydrogenase